MAKIPLHVIPRPRFIASATLVLLNWVFTIVYRFPDIFVRRVTVPGEVRVSIISYVDRLGPIWELSFLIAALAMTFTLVTRRLIIIAHTIGGMVWAAYSTALLFGVFASSPIGSPITSALAVAVCFFHASLVDAYSGDLARKEPDNER